MQVIFIHHSCFLVEVDEKVLIFDWFDGDRVEGYHFGGVLPEYEPDTPVYVFASHKHRDHFDMDVLHLAEKYPKIRFIFSKDCKMSPHFLTKHGFAPEVAKRIHYVGADEKCRVDDLNIETLRSTDAGVAFYVETNGAAFYHAGDLPGHDVAVVRVSIAHSGCQCSCTQFIDLFQVLIFLFQCQNLSGQLRRIPAGASLIPWSGPAHCADHSFPLHGEKLPGNSQGRTLCRANVGQ